MLPVPPVQQAMPTVPPARPTPVAASGWQIGPPASQQPPVLAAQAAGLNQAKVRGAIPDTSPTAPPPPQPPQPLRLPSPAELGIAAPTVIPVANTSTVPATLIPNATPAVAFDWNEALGRLQRLGAQQFHIDQLPGGGASVTLVLPDGGTGRHVHTTGATSADAVNAALRQAEGK
jgi:hypothetical protein